MARVQGVGFRYTTRLMVNKIGLNGYVSNQMDGSVKIVLQGSEDKIDVFRQQLIDENYGFARIKKVTISEINMPEFSDFSIR